MDASRKGIPIPEGVPIDLLRLPADEVFNVGLPPMRRPKRRLDNDADEDHRPAPPVLSPQGIFAPLRRPAEHADLTFPVISTDGSYTNGNSGLESNQEDLASPRAGWGFTVATPSSGWLFDACGPVALAPLSPEYLGAARLSNNTGELTAMVVALRWLLHAGFPSARLEYDSQYAADVVRKVSRPHTNLTLVLQARRAFEDCESRGISVLFVKVRGHSNNALNDRADGLAEAGALLSSCRPQSLLRSCFALRTLAN